MITTASREISRLGVIIATVGHQNAMDKFTSEGMIFN
jgi:hypothetical protein